MGVDDDVGHNPAFGNEWHILLRKNHPDGPLLAVTTAEFVANPRHPNGPDTDLHKPVSVAVTGFKRRVDYTGFIVSQGRALVVKGLVLGRVLPTVPNRNRLANDDIPTSQRCVGLGEPVFVDGVVRTGLESTGECRVRQHKLFLFPRHLVFPFVVFVGSVKRRVVEPPVHRVLANQQRIFLIESRVRHNGHNRIGPIRHIVLVQHIGHFGLNHRDHWIMQNVSKRIQSFAVIGTI